MKFSRMIIPTVVLAGAALGQTPPPRHAAPTPPAPPAVEAAPTPAPLPQARPMPPVPPEPALAPLPPLPPDLGDWSDRLLDLQDRLGDMKFNFNFDSQALKERIKESTRDFAFDIAARAPQMVWDTYGPFALAPQRVMGRARTMAEDSLYNAGQRALDSRRYTEALEDFNQVAARAGNRADGALYWKAYTLIKLGRRDEAVAAIGELRKSYPNSRWLDDAKVLEVDAGKPVSPESESDEELKLIALNGLMQSDPDRALPILENLLKGNQPPSLKKRVVYVLAASSSPKAQQLLEQVAKGQGNPDMQIVAIRYLGEKRNQPAKSQLLADVYNSSSDPNIKRAVLTAFESSRDRDHLLQIARSEKNQDLRLFAIRMLGSISGSESDLWQIYQNEPNVEVKQQILESMPSAGNQARMLEIAKTEKDPKLRRYAIQVLSSPRSAGTGDALAALYANEQDQDVKRAILDALHSQRNAKDLVQIARAEKEPKMKQRIVERLVSMKSPEATDYLMEILK